MVHTHPTVIRDGEPDYYPFPSPEDMSVAISLSALGKTAGSIVYTTGALSLYGAGPTLVQSFNHTKYREWRLWALIFDVYTAMEGRRSWHKYEGGWGPGDVEDLLSKFGIFYATVGLKPYYSFDIYYRRDRVEHGKNKYFHFARLFAQAGSRRGSNHTNA